MMQTMDHNAWSHTDTSTEWSGDYQVFPDYGTEGWDASTELPYEVYGHPQDFGSWYQDWIPPQEDGGYLPEDWGMRAPKFPPPNMPAPDVLEGLAMQAAFTQAQAMVLAQRQYAKALSKEMKASKKVVKPPGKSQAGDSPPPGLDMLPKMVDVSADSTLDEGRLSRGPVHLPLTGLKSDGKCAKDIVLPSATPSTASS